MTLRRGTEGFPEPAHGRAGASTVVACVLIGIVVAGMVGALLALEEQSGDVRAAQEDLTNVSTTAYRLDSTTLELLTAKPSELPFLRAEAAKRIDDATDAVEQLHRGGDVPPEIASSVARQFAPFRSGTLQLLELLRHGFVADAVALSEGAIGLPLDSLEGSLATAKAEVRHQAQVAEWEKVLGSTGALLLGGIIVVLLIVRVGRGKGRLEASNAREESLQDSEDRFRSLMFGSADVIAVLNAKGVITFMSSSAERMVGYTPDQLLGSDVRVILDEDGARAIDGLLARGQVEPGMQETVEWRMRTASGDTVPAEAVVSSRFDDPEIRGLLVNVRDASERLGFENALRDQLLHDPLTTLANRTLFEDRMNHAFDHSARSGDSLCVLLADIDEFKDINDSFGHDFGDKVLIQTAARLRTATRPSDTVARLGGDEFAVLIDEVHGLDDGARVATRIMESLEEPITIGDTHVQVQVSVGVATGSAVGCPQGELASRRGQLLIEADLAMYEAKRAGRGRFQFFAPQMQEELHERLVMRSELERALHLGEFVVHYQPICSIDSGEIVGAEALVRWQHPERGLVPPLEFIPIAEQSGLILELGRWVMRDACAEASRWQAPASGELAPYVTVNISGQQLQQATFVDEVAGILAQTGLDPRRLVIEVTETALIDDTGVSERKLREFHELGVRLAIDDFGTGYSALSYLRQFRMDILKIDKSFVDHLGHELGDRSKGPALVEAMVAMGASLDMQVVAEGIEQQDQVGDLRRLNCHLGQGFLFAKPVPASDLEVLLAAGTSAEASR